MECGEKFFSVREGQKNFPIWIFCLHSHRLLTPVALAKASWLERNPILFNLTMMQSQELATHEPLETLDELSSSQNEWTQVCETLSASVSHDAFQRWFRAAKWLGVQDDIGTVSVPGEIHQVWIETNYLPELTMAVVNVFENVRSVKVIVCEESTGTDSKASNKDCISNGNADDGAALKGDALERRVKASGLNPSNTFESFVVGANSQFAHAACEAVAKKSGISYNPLFIYGGPGLGKTHLMQAIGHEMLRRQPGTRVIYLTCEKFTNEFIDAVRRGDIEKFRRRYRSSDVLLIDDVQFLAGKERSQEEFFHTFNTLLDGRNQVVLTSDRPACEIKSLEPRLVSRFECGLTVEMQPPQMETRIAILKRKSLDWKIRLDHSILAFLAEKIRSNVRRLEGALMRVATYTSLAGEHVAVEKIEHLLHDLLREEASRQINIDSIQKAVAEHYDVRLADMTSRRRPASIAFPRQVAMFLSRSLTKSSLVEIGEAFGGRDHGTVIHACKKVTDLIEAEPGLKQGIARIESQLRR